MTSTHHDIVQPFLSGTVPDFPTRRRLSQLEKEGISLIQFTLRSNNGFEQRVEVIDGQSRTVNNRRFWEGTVLPVDALEDDESTEPETRIYIKVVEGNEPVYTIQ